MRQKLLVLFITWFRLGVAVHSSTSKGRIWRGWYYVANGKIDKGDIIVFTDN
jgi:hypothetical protein